MIQNKKTEFEPGDIVQMFTIIKEVDKVIRKGDGFPMRAYLCRCICGKETIKNIYILRQGGTKSCGCFAKAVKTTHGCEGTKMYNVYRSMKNKAKKNGEEIAPLWETYAGFLYDMELTYREGLYLSRRNKTEPWNKENCKWMTPSEIALRKDASINPENIGMGDRFGHLRILYRADNDVPSKKRKYRFKCLCDCGKETYADLAHLAIGRIKSCGCKKTENVETHGMSHTREYTTWRSMFFRCYNPRSTGYEHYGGRGITVCKRWTKSFDNFYADMGDRPSDEHSIDRIDNDGNYTPSNCRWATAKQQHHNRRPLQYKNKKNGKKKVQNTSK